MFSEKELKEEFLLTAQEMGISLRLENDDVDLRDYLVDSFQFITFVLDLEQRLNCNFPDEFLQYENLASLNSLCQFMSEYFRHE